MPLEVENGFSLSPTIPEAPTPEVDFAGLSGGPPDENISPVILKIKNDFQLGKLWCWAACVEMVLTYYQKGMSQCQIVTTKLRGDGEGATPVCSPNPNLNLEDCDPRRVAQTWRDCGIEGVIPQDGHLELPEIKQELKSGRPIEVGIEWDEGGGHVVLIKGWAATNPESLVINDPLRGSPLVNSPDGSGRATHDELRDAFGQGEWVYTWKNLV